MPIKNSRRFHSAIFAMISCLPLLGSCGISTIGGQPNPRNGLDHVDPALNLTRDDYRHMAAPKSGNGKEEPLTYSVDKGAPPIPPIAEILAAPRPPKIGESQLVSIAVTDDVPLKDVLLELAKLADIDIEVDSGITGGVEFIAKNKPFNEVIDRLAALADLRYTMKDGVLHVERDTPYVKSYTIDFLNLDRESDTSVSSSTAILANSSGSGGSSTGGNGSSGNSKATSKSDFWKALEDSVQQILAYQEAPRVSATTMQADIPSNTLSTAPATPNAPAGKEAAATPTASVTQQANNTGIANGIAQNKTSYTINRQAGVLTVNATAKQHEMIERMLAVVKSNASAQVLIEAKIIEVTLDDEYASGINWTAMGAFGNKIVANLQPNISGSSNAISTLTSVVGATGSAAGSGITFAANNGQDILNLLESYGTTRTLSSPRLHAINNQQSTLTFATNVVFFKLNFTYTPAVVSASGTTPATSTVTSTPSTVPDGIIMTLMPSIDLENNEVTMAVRPTLSTIVKTVNDPGVAFAVAQAESQTTASGAAGNSSATAFSGITSPVPQVEVRELDSTLKLRSGQTMVIGGLMSQKASNVDTGVPFAASIPVLGNLFKGVSKTVQNTELVILIKATIVDAHGDVNKTDKRIFDKFSDDPRPVSF